MQKSDFYFDLPQELIAQLPAEPRDSARLLCLGRHSGTISHHIFSQLPDLLKPGDLLVVNNSKVLPARILGTKQGGNALCELLLLREKEKDVWECLARPGKRIHPGNTLVFGDGTLIADILEVLENGGRLVRFKYNTSTLYEKLDQFGKMPLPPYITQESSRPSDYQTVYAKEIGSSAAPTAGLHFTEELINRLKTCGIGFAEVTLHVGLGTFRPVKEEKLENHQMHSEYYILDKDAADLINQTKANGGRVIAVGTTSCRTLESVFQQNGKICASSGETDIFIYPGYEFGAIDGLITNFHLPESTLIMLVSAFCGYESTMSAYKKAIEDKYRFFSFGDGMLII